VLDVVTEPQQRQTVSMLCIELERNFVSDILIVFSVVFSSAIEADTIVFLSLRLVCWFMFFMETELSLA
jgi:hypothetical protein